MPESPQLLERAERSGVRLLTRTLAFGIYDHNLVCARQTLQRVRPRLASTGGVLRERLWKIRARAVIAASRRLRASDDFPEQRSSRRHAGGRRGQIRACLRRRLR